MVVSATLTACDKGRELAQNKDERTEMPFGGTSGSATSGTGVPSPSETTAALKPLVMEFARPVKGAAVLDYLEPPAAGPRCRIHRACEPFARLEPCAPGIEPIESSTIGTFAPLTLGQRVSVRGPLGLTLTYSGFAACNPGRCCNPTKIGVFVGDVPNGMRLEGLACYGDESRLCCPVPAFGQVVVATGRIMDETSPSVLAHGGRFMLADPVLCTEARSNGSAGDPGRP